MTQELGIQESWEGLNSTIKQFLIKEAMASHLTTLTPELVGAIGQLSLTELLATVDNVRELNIN